MIVYHLSFKKLNSLVFDPQIPKQPIFNEDVTFPRICVCKSILDCIKALPSNYNKIFYSYKFDVDENDVLTSKEIQKYVPDALETNEMWLVSQHKAKYDGKIIELKSNDWKYAKRKKLIYETN